MSDLKRYRLVLAERILEGMKRRRGDGEPEGVLERNLREMVERESARQPQGTKEHGHER
jgi:hypothetical protein